MAAFLYLTSFTALLRHVENLFSMSNGLGKARRKIVLPHSCRFEDVGLATSVALTAVSAVIF